MHLWYVRQQGPGFESQAQHLCCIQFIFEFWLRKDENNQKEAGIGLNLKFFFFFKIGFELASSWYNVSYNIH